MILRGVTNKFYKLLKGNLSTRFVLSARCFSHEDDDNTSDKNNKINSSPFSTLEKYKIFNEVDSPVIFDIAEERLKAIHNYSEPQDEYHGLNLERGKEGVFDIDDIVELLRREQVKHIFVVKIPQEFKYVSYLVIVSGKSVRHMQAVAEFVKKVYKKKRNARDYIPKIEGEDTGHWIAMDMGNIALHIFSDKARQTYDLESLWSVGSEYDELNQKAEDPVLELIQKHSVYLKDLESPNNG